MKTLDEILIARGEIDRIFGGEHRIDLWRAIRKDDPRVNPLHPDLHPRELPNGRIRLPDLERFRDPKTGRWMVRAKIGQGTSV